MKYLLDSYAWIEYFIGTEAGEHVKHVIEGLDEKITPTICLAEVYAKTLRVEGKVLAEEQRIFIREKSALAALDERTAVEAAKIDSAIKAKVRGWGIADSIIYTAGLSRGDKIITEDEHFRNLGNIIFIN